MKRQKEVGKDMWIEERLVEGGKDEQRCTELTRVQYRSC